MSRWLYRFPVNITLPLLLLFTFFGLATIYIIALIQTEKATIQENSRRELTNEISRMQRIGQYLLDQGDLTRLQEEIGALGPDIRVCMAFVVNADGRVIASLDRLDRGKPLLQVLEKSEHGGLGDPLLGQIAVARETWSARTEYFPENQVMLSSGPLEMPRAEARLGPPPLGAIVIAWELDHPFAQARQDALETGLYLAPLVAAAFLGVWWMTYAMLGRRLGALTRTAERIAEGNNRLRTDIFGRDEVGRLARAFNRMTDALVEEHDLLEESEHRLSLAQKFSNIGSWVWDIDSGDLTWSEHTYRILGFSDSGQEMNLDRFVQKIAPEDRPLVEDALAATLETGKPYDVEYRVINDAGATQWVLARGDVLRNSAGKPLRMYGIVHDITDTKAAEDALFREKEHAQVTLASIGDGVITTDTSGRIEFLNPVAEELTGWKTADARGKSLRDVFKILDEVTRSPAADPVARCLREGRIVGVANHTVLLRGDGVEFAIEDSAAPIRDRSGEIVGVVLVFHDVTSAREMANRLSWQASHDALTSLHNRMAFEERLHDLAHNPLPDHRNDIHTLLYIDLDQFKVVNDIAGHVAGDEMLKQVAGIMQQQVRDNDLLARLGGDEFGVILTHCDINHAQRVADAIHNSLDHFKFAWDDRVFRVGASIGVLEFRPGEVSLSELLSAADMACYAAKKAGRRRTHVYEPDDVHLQRHRSEMDWASRISDAVEQNRLVLFGQTIEPLKMSEASDALAFEVLVRMKDEQGNLIAPGMFLPAAERFDLISIVDRWIITRTFSMVADCTARHGPDSIAHCAINLSGGTLGDSTLLSFIKNQLTLHQVPAHLFCFEITETAAISNFQEALRFIRDLRAMGCRFALDDFGSGLSSFSYLKNLPVDYLKIDGIFVRDIVTDRVNRTLVSNINDVGHLLGKRTIAEYAEDDETIRVLRELGVDHAQGYGVGRPKPLDEILARCKEITLDG